MWLLLLLLLLLLHPVSARECETIKNSGYSTAELRKDIEEMENEKEIVQKRIERMQRKVGGGERLDNFIDRPKKILYFGYLIFFGDAELVFIF